MFSTIPVTRLRFAGYTTHTLLNGRMYQRVSSVSLATMPDFHDVCLVVTGKEPQTIKMIVLMFHGSPVTVPIEFYHVH
jgi:hypothetical protein